MTLEIVSEHAQRPRGAAHLLERAIDLLELRGVRPNDLASVAQGTGRVMKRAVDLVKRAACAH